MSTKRRDTPTVVGSSVHNVNEKIESCIAEERQLKRMGLGCCTCGSASWPSSLGDAALRASASSRASSAAWATADGAMCKAHREEDEPHIMQIWVETLESKNLSWSAKFLKAHDLGSSEACRFGVKYLNFSS
jgi:hypothetical protein